jgi:hypothetical protein
MFGRAAKKAIKSKKIKSLLGKLNKEFNKILLQKTQNSAVIQKRIVYTIIVEFIEMVNRIYVGGTNGNATVNQQQKYTIKIVKSFLQGYIQYLSTDLELSEVSKEIGLDQVVDNFLNNFKEFQKMLEEWEKLSEEELTKKVEDFINDNDSKYLKEYYISSEEEGSEKEEKKRLVAASAELVDESLLILEEREYTVDMLKQIIDQSRKTNSEEESKTFKEKAIKISKENPKLYDQLPDDYKSYIKSGKPNKESAKESSTEKVKLPFKPGQKVIYVNQKGETRGAIISDNFQEGVQEGSIKVKSPDGKAEFAIWPHQIVKNDPRMKKKGDEIIWFSRSKKTPGQVNYGNLESDVNPDNTALIKYIGKIEKGQKIKHKGSVPPIRFNPFEEKFADTKGTELPPAKVPLLLTTGGETSLIKKGEQGLIPFDDKEKSLAVIKKMNLLPVLAKQPTTTPPTPPKTPTTTDGGDGDNEGDKTGKDKNELIKILLTKLVNDSYEIKVIDYNLSGDRIDSYRDMVNAELTEEERTKIKLLLKQDIKGTWFAKTKSDGKLFNPFVVASIFRSAQDEYSITSDEYGDVFGKDEKKVLGGALAKIGGKRGDYEKSGERYRNKKLYNQWFSGVMNLLDDYKNESVDNIYDNTPPKNTAAPGSPEIVGESKSYKEEILNEADTVGISQVADNRLGKAGVNKKKTDKRVDASTKVNNKVLPDEILDFISDMLESDDVDKASARLVRNYFGLSDEKTGGPPKPPGTKNPDEDKDTSRTESDVLTLQENDVDGNPVNITVKEGVNRSLFNIIGKNTKSGESIEWLFYVLRASRKGNKIEFKISKNKEYGWLKKYNGGNPSLDMPGFEDKSENPIYYGILVGKDVIKSGNTINIQISKKGIHEQNISASNLEDISIEIEKIEMLLGKDDNLQYQFPTRSDYRITFEDPDRELDMES